MTSAMTHRWYLRATAAALAFSALAFGAGFVGFFRISHARRDSLREWNTQRCSVYRASLPGAEDPCAEVVRDGPTIISSLHAARAHITSAKIAIARGDDVTASRDLAVALAQANVVERRSSMFATAIAARITSEVLDVIDANPAVARDLLLRAALEGTTLPTAHKPLEADRLRIANAALTDPKARTAFLTWGAGDARIADAVEREDGLMLSMQHAVRNGDQAACERAGAKAMMGPYVCASLVRTTATAKRLSSMSARSRGLAADQRLDLRPR